MTCIIGLVDTFKKCVWIGGDSLGSNFYTKAVERTPKIFQHEVFRNVVMGGTTSFRHLDLLRYSKDLFPEVDWYKNTLVDHKYMVTVFIPNVIKIFKEGVISEDEENRGGNFIVGVKDRLFEIQQDYSVLEPEDGFCAVGSGEDIALGSLITSGDRPGSPSERITLALKAAEKVSCGVQRPFRILNTENSEEIRID